MREEEEEEERERERIFKKKKKKKFEIGQKSFYRQVNDKKKKIKAHFETDVQIGHQTIATFRNRYAWTVDSRIGNWSTDLLSHFLSLFIF